MPHVLNSETAKLAGQKSGEARKRYALERKQALEALKTLQLQAIAAKPVEQPIEQPQSDYAAELVRAQSELLAELLATPQAKDKAALSQAIKNLKESWHMETGKPKPGTIKPVSARPRQQSHESPDAPNNAT